MKNLMNKRTWIAAVVILAVAVVAVFSYWALTRAPSPPALILQREWTANAEFAGDVWAAELAREHGITLQVREGSELIDPVKQVRSGIAHFGVASADRILVENDGGADLVIIAAASYKSPVVFLARPQTAIATPGDMRGHVVGIQSGTNTELVFHALLRAQGIQLDDVKVVESGWGTANFETGAIDVLGAFAYDEPVTLELKHVDFTTLFPEDYGVRYVGTVYFTRRAFAAEHSEMVQGFVDALVDGWKHALEKPDEAIALVGRRFPSVSANAAKERASLERGRPYFGGEDGQLLYASQSRWTAMAADLVAQGRLRSFDFAKTVDYHFLSRAPQ